MACNILIISGRLVLAWECSPFLSLHLCCCFFSTVPVIFLSFCSWRENSSGSFRTSLQNCFHSYFWGVWIWGHCQNYTCLALWSFAIVCFLCSSAFRNWIRWIFHWGIGITAFWWASCEADLKRSAFTEYLWSDKAGSSSTSPKNRTQECDRNALR